MVAGQPVAVQSPARKSLLTAVSCFGRHRSTPGCGENVAAASLMTVAFTRFASRAPGRTWRTSARQRSMISWRGFWRRPYEALMTSWRYCLAAVAPEDREFAASPLSLTFEGAAGGPKSAVLL